MNPKDLNPTNANPTDTSPTGRRPTNTSLTDTSPTSRRPTNTSPTDTSPTDTGPTSRRPTDTGPTDSRLTDTSPTNARRPANTSPTDTGPTSRRLTDTSPTDTSPTDTSPTNASPPDANLIGRGDTLGNLNPAPAHGAPRGPILVGMSGGVDSSVAAALLIDAGYDVTGATLKLWGGESDSGCCSVADVDDARRVCDRLGIDHHVFNFGDEFNEHVVHPYVADHEAGRTPNPCIECNRHLKFDRFLTRARALGFNKVATGHHARIVERADGSRRIGRGADTAKDQSYVLYMLDQPTLTSVELPLGTMTKDRVRAKATELGLSNANKPDSQDVCFLTAAHGRETFLGSRIPLRPGRVVDTSGSVVGHVESVQLVTIGQRRGLKTAGGGAPRYVVDVDPQSDTVTVGGRGDLQRTTVELIDMAWSDQSLEQFSGQVLAQTRAHGMPQPARFDNGTITWDEPQPRVAPGQSVVLFEDDEVLGGGLAL